MTITLDRNSIEAALAEGRQALASDPRRAAEYARSLLALAPGSADAYRLLAAALRRLGENDRANEAELAAIEAAGNDPELLHAGQTMVAGDLPAAEQVLRSILQRRPDDFVAIRMLAEIAAGVGLYRDSERLLRRALELAPGFDYARFHLALTLNAQDRVVEAFSEIDKVRGELRDDEETLRLRASLLSRIGDYEECIAAYRQLAELLSDDGPVLISLGFALQNVGRQAEAVETYRRALAANPTLGEAWWSLANLKTFRFSGEDIAAMQAALSAATRDDDRLHLQFALGKAYEDRGSDETAFRHYDEGNAIRRAQLRHEPGRVTALVEATERLFTPEFLAGHANAGCQAPDPIFIVGMPRAGSTLIEQILASHPEIEGTSELADILVLARSLEPDERFLGEQDWKRYPDLLAGFADNDLKQLGELYLERTRVQRKTDKPYFIDKMPNNWVHTGFIKLILPNAKIIDARRHPLACGFSNFKQHYARGQEFSYDLEHFGLYYRDYVRLMRHFDEVMPGAVHRVIHEQLVADPEAEIRRLLDFVGVPFDQAVLKFHETERPVRSASSEQVRRPIDASGTEQWQRFEQWLDPLKSALGPALEHWRD